ncbi:NAD(+) kinase [Halobacteriales archaeon QS_1_68_17]|nr:MAG: NAD(+) kinase [Halobacteriales archaeon QS_1_68_17]
MEVGVVGQQDNPRAAELAAEIAETLTDLDATVVVDAATAATLGSGATPSVRSGPVEEMDDRDLVVSIGGDGTFLFAARGAGTTPIMGVNLGEVGFLNAVSPADAPAVVAREVEHIRETGRARTVEMPRLCASGDGWELSPAINEVTVLGPQRGHGNGVGVEVRVDGSLYASGHADGVLVATPTGSTAYNLSEGGPLVHPRVDGLVVTEMCAAESMPPLVVELDSEIEVGVADAEGAVVVVSDGRISREIDPPARVQLRRAGHPVRIAGPPLDFFTALGKLD